MVFFLQTVCTLLECLLTPENVPPDSPKEAYEVYFVFACVWAFGGTLLQDQVCQKSFQRCRFVGKLSFKMCFAFWTWYVLICGDRPLWGAPAVLAQVVVWSHSQYWWVPLFSMITLLQVNPSPCTVVLAQLYRLLMAYRDSLRHSMCKYTPHPTPPQYTSHLDLPCARNICVSPPPSASKCLLMSSLSHCFKIASICRESQISSLRETEFVPRAPGVCCRVFL